MVRSDELESASGIPCPDELPLGEDPSRHGFGTEAAADALPTLLEPQETWVCQYDAVDAATTPDGGTTYARRRAGQPVAVSSSEVAGLRAALHELAIPEPGRGCTDDLGPRWMIVYTHDGDLTGIVVDDFSCRSVRLTDNPHTTPPGADNQEGTVGGVLDGGAKILDAVGVGRSD